ncbi:MAG: hypothetical protein K2H59_08065 [Muribaculaceae bacterium]|nr:hypothetical protein [Muribaculaceae bacterium]
MKNKTLVFLKPFSIKNPTLDEQNDFMMTEVFVESECADLGTFYNNDMLYGKNLEEFIPDEVKKHNPEWIIAVGQSATIALGIQNQKKVLLNPKVDYEHLNNVSEFDCENTYGFFDEYHEQDYERFQSVFQNAAWFPQDDNLNLFTIKEIVTDIING